MGELGEPAAPTRLRRWASWLITVLSLACLWVALIAPDRLGHLTPAAFARVPLEGLVLVVLVLVLPPRAGRVLAMLCGVVLALLTILRMLDMGFYVAFDRPFDALYDATYLGPGFGLLSDSIGRTGAVLAAVAAGLVCLALLTLLPLALLRVTRLVAQHRASSIRVVAALAVISTLSAVTGVRVTPGMRVASTSTADLAIAHAGQLRHDIRDQQAFGSAVADDRFRDTPGRDLLTGLRGKDVLLVFVESYGRVAVEGSAESAPVASALAAGTRRLRAAGFSARSAFLTSPTFGGLSWLAHSTLQSGVWVDNQQRYDDLAAGDRFTLSGAFARAGWHTVGVVPANGQDWPQGRTFYHFDTIYDSRNVGYAGPKFSYATMPDQYTLAAFRRLELARPDRAPVMAEIDLVSSHTPWAPLPRLVDWDAVGDGSVFDAMPAQGQSPDIVWRDPHRVQAAYGQSIVYSLDTLTSFVRDSHDMNLVLVVLGDHQPATIVSGEGASHDVPISIIAADPAVVDRISGWGWQAGLRPAPDAPVWPMDAFRDRFLAAYSR
jgi:hypothetical protein